VPLVPGRELAITSNEVFRLKERPQRVVIVGGGYIGVEFAGVFKGLGSEVTLVHRPGGLLRGFDEDVRAALAEGMVAYGVKLVESEDVQRIEEVEGGARRLSMSCGEVVEGDVVLFATGRAPMTRGLGLESAGVTLDRRGAVVVNELFQSTVPTIYAVGDVSNRTNLTPVALAEGSWLARHLFGGEEAPMAARLIPTAVFSKPQVATVGMTEAQARATHSDVAIYMSKFRTLKDTITLSSARTLMKLIVDRQTDRVLGCHMVGPDAAEIVQGFAVALGCGATKRQLDATLGIHPTAAEEFVTMRQPVR
jgi:glutathione reductase (NADPH)